MHIWKNLKGNYSTRLLKIARYFSNKTSRNSDRRNSRFGRKWRKWTGKNVRRSFFAAHHRNSYPLKEKREIKVEEKWRSIVSGRERKMVSLAKFLSFADELCFPTLAFPSIIKGNDTTGHSFHGSLSLSPCSDFRAYTEKAAWSELRVALVPCIIHKSDARDMSWRGCVSMRSSFIVLQIGCFNIVESANEIY